MKLIFLIISVLLYHNYNVNSFKIYDFVTNKVNAIGITITGAFKNLRNKLKLFMFPELKEKRCLKKIPFNHKSNTKSAFCDFVEDEGAQTDANSHEYTGLNFEPTASMSTPQLATIHGKRMESHVVLTNDGYLLTLHRLRSTISIQYDNNEIESLTILLHHGLLGSSADWILLGPEKSLPYLLSDRGHDVWLANARGNYYSKGHVSKNIHSLDFWNFTFQEMGKFDLPAIIDYIRKVKNTNVQINYIGHSMGATAFLVMCSLYPDYNRVFRIGIFLAPLAYMSHTEGPLKVLTKIAKPLSDQLIKLLGAGEFVPNRKIPDWIANKYCMGPELHCLNPLLFLCGDIPNYKLWDKNLTTRILYHVPAAGSTNTILHFAQMIRSGTFHKYNNEDEEYSLDHVTVPIALISSSEDWLATIPDVLKLYYSIVNPIDHYIIRGKNLSHVDFLWNPNADNLIYDKVIDFLENMLNITSYKANETF